MNSATVPSPNFSHKNPWNIQHWTNPERSDVSSDGQVLDVICMPKKQGMDSGTGFFAQPPPFPCSQIRVSYEIFVPEDFTWVNGGKFGFGLGLGRKNAKEIASGGDWKEDAGSLRTMWRADGQVIGYVYLPLEGKSRDGVIRAQTSAVEKACDGSVGKDTGMNVWFKIPEKEQLRLKKGKWNSVTLQAKLNAPGKADGVLSLTVNDKTQAVDAFKFRQSDDIVFNGMVFHTFFGGSTLEWACKTPQTLKFRKVSVS